MGSTDLAGSEVRLSSSKYPKDCPTLPRLRRPSSRTLGDLPIILLRPHLVLGELHDRLALGVQELQFNCCVLWGVLLSPHILVDASELSSLH